MKAARFIMLLGLSLSLGAQGVLQFKLEGRIPDGGAPSEIPFITMFPLTLSPWSFCLKDGRTAVINAGGSFKAYDLMEKRIAYDISYPQDRRRPADIEFFYLASSMRWSDSGFVSHNESSICGLLDPSGSSISDYLLFVDDDLSGHFFTYRQVVDVAVGIDKDGNEYGLLPTGKIVNLWEQLGWDRFLSRPFQRLPESARRLQADRMRDKHLIVDGLIYPASFADLKNYCTDIGIEFTTELPFNNPGTGTEPIGQSYYGDIYFRTDTHILVIDQCGKLLATLDMDPINPKHSGDGIPDGQERPDTRGPFVAIHPNGDVYALTAVEGRGNFIWKVQRSWGMDCLSLARSGLEEGPGAETLALLESFSDQELRVTRNALFAFQGYAFKSTELRNVFQGFPWYAPNPAAKADTALLEPAARRLFERIRAIEAEREAFWPQGGYPGYPREGERLSL